MTGLPDNGAETFRRIDLAPGQRVVGIGRDAPQGELLQPARIETDPASPERGESASEGEQVHLGHHTFADKRPRTASSFQHALAHQHLGCLSNGRTSQVVAGGQLVFRWDARPWRIESGADLLAQLVGQLLVICCAPDYVAEVPVLRDLRASDSNLRNIIF